MFQGIRKELEIGNDWIALTDSIAECVYIYMDGAILFQASVFIVQVVLKQSEGTVTSW